MALRFIGSGLLRTLSINWQLGGRASVYTLQKIGKREIVGHGHNGTECYRDNLSFPMPAVRFRELNNETTCLRAKELLSWNKLTLHEKKTLYRHSFCQTFSEMKAGTGEPKLFIGLGMLAISVGVWVSLIMNKYLYDELPDSFDEEHQKAQLKRMLALEVNPVTGLASKWDYENNKWK